MADLRIVVDGDDAERAANELSAILAEGESSAVIARSPVSALPPVATRKVVDPISLAAMVLAIPGAVLATADLADRIRKRRKAERLVAAARRLQHERVTVSVIAPNGVLRPMEGLEADTVLEIAQQAADEP